MPTLKHLNALDYSVVVCYLLMVAVVGIYFARFNRKTSDYFKAGGKLPWVISSLSMFVSGFSAFMFVSASGFTYRNGLSSILLFSSGFLAYMLGYFIFGKLWRRARLDSPMELLTRRYSQSTTYYYSLISVIPNILLMGALIYTLCIFISSALGFGKLHLSLGSLSFSGFELTLVAVGAVLLLYTVLGGLWAVAITDTLQFLIMLLMTLAVFPLSFMYLGDGNFLEGFRQLRQQAPPGLLSLSSVNLPFLFVLAFWLQNFLGYNTNWHIGQRYYSIADERDTKKMAATCAVFSLVAPLMWILPVLVARIIFPDMQALWPELTEPTEASFASLCLLMLPHGLLGVVVSAILAASMSSADSTFNWLAAVITKDVYVPISRRINQGREPSDRLQLVIGKLTVMAVGILAILASLSMQKFGGSFDIYLKIYSITVPAMFVPVFIGMIYRKTPWWSAIAASVAGIVFVLIASALANTWTHLPLRHFSDLFRDLHLEYSGVQIGRYELNIYVGLIVSSATLFLTSKWPNKNQVDIQRLQAFDQDLRTPAIEPKARYDLKGIQAYKMVGWLSGITGLLLIFLGVWVQGTGGRVINLLTGLGAILFGLLFWKLVQHYEG